MLLLGAVPISNKVFDGGVPKFYGDSEGGYPFFTHTKKETEQSKISLLCIFPTALDAPFARFAPAALKSFRHPGGGVPIFDSDSEGGGTKIVRRLRGGGVCVFYGHFSRKGPSPLTRNSEQSLIYNQHKCAKSCSIDFVKTSMH